MLKLNEGARILMGQIEIMKVRDTAQNDDKIKRRDQINVKWRYPSKLFLSTLRYTSSSILPHRHRKQNAFGAAAPTQK